MQWDRLEFLLFSLDKYLFIAYFLCLILAVRIEKKASSVLITLTVVALANGVMTSLVPLLYRLAANDGIEYKFIWYGTFSLIDVLSIYLLYKFHKLMKQNVSSIAELAGAAFLSLATLQVAFFIEQYAFASSYLKPFYQYGIPLINVLLLPVLVFLWVAQRYHIKQRLQGAL
ncbi:MAG: hypothetical protein KKE30_13245 [Gammaproteobacteria bacterium]|nr:hypothetical protein [Gammaproteobacteria bacterium]MBU1557271.1 hypothetical protein [Gammaproteobacteria bacterium]MBU2071634.1 hypothetical protein [Gammaproteobacteria bacterium]MBU2182866.1 hypothetical protein [Gammaproteobacteria bacterium]MBU2203488.1 hypothetical protein [Gammaproteobacteria bacterium]